MDLQFKLFLNFLVLAILKDIIIYSVGRSHDTSKLEFHIPTIKEWLLIIVLICVLYWIGGYIAQWFIN